MSLPPRSYLEAHLERTRHFLSERGLAKPQQPQPTVPDAVARFLETV